MPNSSGSRSRLDAESVGKRVVGADLERCIVCNGSHITREGKRYKKLETVQLWRCHTCDRVFTPQRAKGKTYPLTVILEALMAYYRGATREQTAVRIKERFGIAVPPRTLSPGSPNTATSRPTPACGRSAQARSGRTD